jgi:hypothetical protein
MPATPAGADQRPRAVQAMGGGELLDGLGAGGAVDVEDIEPLATGEADVGVGVAGPPGQHAGPVTGGVGDAVGDQPAQGVLANLAAVRIPAGTANRQNGRRQVSAAGGLEVAVVGEGIVQG